MNIKAIAIRVLVSVAFTLITLFLINKFWLNVSRELVMMALGANIGIAIFLKFSNKEKNQILFEIFSTVLVTTILVFLFKYFV